MQAARLLRLVWKEERATRWLWLLACASAALGDLMVLLFAPDKQVSRHLFWIAATVASAFALGCGAALFAREREEQTADLMRMLPAERAELLVGKALFGLTATLAVAVLLSLAALSMSRGSPRNEQHAPYGVCVFAVESLACGALCSLTAPRALNAAAWGGAGVIGLSLVSGEPLHEFGSARWGMLGAILLVDGWLGWKWTADPRAALFPPCTIVRARIADWAGRVPFLNSFRLRKANRTIRRLPATSRAQAFRFPAFERFAWQEWRRARRALCGLITAAWVLECGLTLLPEAGDGGWVLILVSTGVFLAGLLSFQNIKAGQTYLVQRGLSPIPLCASVLAVWSLAAALFALAAIVGGWHFQRGTTVPPPVFSLRGVQHWLAANAVCRAENLTGIPIGEVSHAPLFVALLLLGLFAVGQLAASLLVRGVVGLFVGMGGAAVWAAWAATVFALNVPLFVGLFIPILIMFISTLVHWQRRLSRGDCISPGRTCGAVLMLGCIVTLTLTSLWRAIEVSPTPLEAVRVARDVPQRTATCGELKKGRSKAPPSSELGELPLAALERASRLAEAGDIEEWVAATLASRSVLAELPDWASCHPWTSAELREAVRRLGEVHGTFPSPQAAVLIHWSQLRETLNGRKIWQGTTPHTRDRRVWQIVSAACPWERFRARRVLDAVAEEKLALLGEVERRMAQGEPLAELIQQWKSSRRKGVPHSAAWQYYNTTPLLWDRIGPDHEWQTRLAINHEADFRASVIVLALMAWRSEHGALPDSLDVLAGDYLAEVPRDPWSGQAFEYRAQGFANETEFPNRTFQAGEPVLWSVGEAGARGEARLAPVGPRGMPHVVTGIAYRIP